MFFVNILRVQGDYKPVGFKKEKKRDAARISNTVMQISSADLFSTRTKRRSQFFLDLSFI